jgi:hypothetical protein
MGFICGCPKILTTKERCDRWVPRNLKRSELVWEDY